jgi:hypothetical protein
MEQEKIRSALLAGVVTISFIKHNGQARVMKCSLNSKYLPDDDKAKETSMVRTGEVLTVWDVEQNGWRSMRVDAITDWSVDEDGAKQKSAPSTYVG